MKRTKGNQSMGQPVDVTEAEGVARVREVVAAMGAGRKATW